MRSWTFVMLSALVTCCGGEEAADDTTPEGQEVAETLEVADLQDVPDIPLEDFILEPDIADLPADEIPDSDEEEAPPDRCQIEQVVAAVSTDRIRETLADLTALPGRSGYDGQQAALALLQGRLDELGVSSSALEYASGGNTFSNLEVTIPGGSLASEIYAAGAHYDAVSGSPGADDDGSGTAAIVEIARVLSGCSYARTIKLLLFSNEESGTLGSSAYASEASDRGDDIRGFLSLDMIAYGSAGEDLDVATRPAYAALANDVVTASLTWAGQPAVAVIDEACG
jgi:hypothetical protein